MSQSDYVSIGGLTRDYGVIVKIEIIDERFEII
jgi:hypothetical protein